MIDKNCGTVELIDSMGSDESIVRIARISYGRKDTLGKGRLIKLLLNNGHTSVFEHVVFQFRVECPIFTARQIMRHRIGSFTERSMRYTKPASRYMPSDKRMDSNASQNLVIAYHTAQAQYEKLLYEGVPKELARSVLPMGTMTEFYWTINARSMMNFLKLRLAEDAQYEVREIAKQVLEHFKMVLPITAMEFMRMEGLV